MKGGLAQPGHGHVDHLPARRVRSARVVGGYRGCI
jgi:hypothetical protein